MKAYYNEYDPKAAAWIRELGKQGHVADGLVDETSIKNLQEVPDGFTRYHFFAGIGGWENALRLAGWPADEPVWTGSCPCQPFSSAGKQQGVADPRHLWPDFFRLISKHRPPIVFGEQVASKAGRLWLAGVRADLEALGYAVGASDLCAASIGAPHIRQRLFWVAHANRDRRKREPGNHTQTQSPTSGGRKEGAGIDEIGERGAIGRLANGQCHGPQGRIQRRQNSEGQDFNGQAGLGGAVSRLGDTESGGCGIGGDASQPGRGGYALGPEWSRFEIIPCRDGKARRIEPGLAPLAHGLPGRVGLLRGYGNAIVPPLAAIFIRSAIEALENA